MRHWLATILCLHFSWANASCADVVFSTFGPGQAFDPLNGSIIEGPSSEFPQIIAEQFTPSVSVYLDRVELAVSSSIGIPELIVSIFSGSGGVPAAALESVHMANFVDGLVTATFSSQIQLDPGSDYWLAVSTTDTNVQMWQDTTPAMFGTQASSEDNGATWFSYNTDPFSRAAFLVAGTPVVPVDPPDVPFLEPASDWRFFRGLSEPSAGVDWAAQAFDDSDWDFGTGGFGYDTDLATQAGLLGHVGTELADMRDDGVNQEAYSSLYLRREFTVVNPFEFGELVLELDYDDSFIAYVNGVEVARSDFGIAGTPEPFDGLGSEHESTNGDSNLLLERFVIDLVEDFGGLLAAGENVLAIQGLNATLDDDDFVLSQLSLGGNWSTARLPGDYNANGIVDAADFTLWRDSLGSMTDLRADGDGNGTVDQGDYDLWKLNFGNTTAGGSSSLTAIPEPASWVLFLAVTGCLLGATRRMRQLSQRSSNYY